ncbi:DUF4365 domain-containing protein [Schlesneria paludicola]|uniref:DUF4365 domain-containing protein n=1 Tax=Schlesneria paludicola TaxID=360056 RepID=UPI000299D58B|nr:DUF4365 domain-containing protein [Schlesneria paludicola]
MDINARKEQFSQAYVQAVAAVAGYCYSKPEVDDDSVDLTLAQKGGGGTVRSPKLDLQLKCHAAESPVDDHFSFPLKKKNYDDLRPNSFQVPRILVVVLVPSLEQEWLEHEESQLSIRRSGYWVSIRGFPDSPNADSVTVHIPRSQPFHPEGLRAIMNRIGAGELP